MIRGQDSRDGGDSIRQRGGGGEGPVCPIPQRGQEGAFPRPMATDHFRVPGTGSTEKKQLLGKLHLMKGNNKQVNR